MRDDHDHDLDNKATGAVVISMTFQDTLEKLRQLEKEDVEDEKKKGGNELNVVRDNRNAESLMETDLDTIEPSL